MTRPRKPKVTPCRSCGRPVIWATTDNGKSMPVDRDPSDDGNVYLEFFHDTGRTSATVVKPGDLLIPEDAKLRKSHFATCPQSKEWRHKK